MSATQNSSTKPATPTQVYLVSPQNAAVVEFMTRISICTSFLVLLALLLMAFGLGCLCRCKSRRTTHDVFFHDLEGSKAKHQRVKGEKKYSGTAKEGGRAKEGNGGQNETPRKREEILKEYFEEILKDILEKILKEYPEEMLGESAKGISKESQQEKLTELQEKKWQELLEKSLHHDRGKEHGRQVDYLD